MRALTDPLEAREKLLGATGVEQRRAREREAQFDQIVGELDGE